MTVAAAVREVSPPGAMPAVDPLEVMSAALGRRHGQTIDADTAMAILGDVAQAMGEAFVMRHKVRILQEAMLPLQQAECPVKHHFAPGLYGREITIPKGVTLVGAVHKTDNLVVMLKGRLELVTDAGAQVIEAPRVLLCKAGKQNAAHALEDTVWINFFPTTETDTDRLVELLSHSKASELLGGAENAQRLAYEQLTLGSPQCP